ncbi:MAG: ComEC/Rec2 family competence protein, partial [Actinomycetota bacterium]
MRAASVAAALVAGVLLADRARPAAPIAASAGVLAILSLGGAWWLHSHNRNDRPGEILAGLSGRTLILLLAGVLLTGFSDLGFRIASADQSPLARMDGRVVEIGGRITSDAARRGPASRFALKTRTADGSPVRGKLSATLYGPLPYLEPGDEVFFTAKMARLDLLESFDGYLFRRGAVAKAVGSAAELRILGKDTVPLMAAANALRRQITRAVGASLPRGRGGLLLGLLIGDESRVPAVTTENFRAAGLSHLTAVSGANVAMVLAPLLLLLTAVGLRRRARIALGIST